MGRKRITPVVEVGQRNTEKESEGTTRIKLRGEKKGDDGEDKFSWRRRSLERSGQNRAGSWSVMLAVASWASDGANGAIVVAESNVGCLS